MSLASPEETDPACLGLLSFFSTMEFKSHRCSARKTLCGERQTGGLAGPLLSSGREAQSTNGLD